MNDLQGINLFVIYLGNACNFNCEYCDRDYIKSLGGQSVNAKTTDDMREFFEWVVSQPNDVKRVSFHGGEPLKFIKRMYQAMEWLYPMAKENGWEITITTNGSKIVEHKDFFEKYGDVFYATISYDFMYQTVNREYIDVDAMAEVLNKNIKAWQWQFVIPIEDPKAFSFDNIKEIVNTCYRTKCRVINIIPLRHIRGKDKFEVIIDRLDLKQFFGAFLEFIQILYIKGLSVWIDGNYERIDKAYFAEHQKAVLSPDGYLYPEFEWLEYKAHEARIGNWRTKELWKNTGDEGKIPQSCMSCEKRPSCGLKYLYHMFDVPPGTACKQFYTYMDWAIFHNTALRNEKSLVHHIGFENVDINS